MFPSFACSNGEPKKKKNCFEKKLGKTQMKKMMSFDAYFVVVVVFFQPKNLISARMMDQPRCLNSSS